MVHICLPSDPPLILQMPSRPFFPFHFSFFFRTSCAPPSRMTTAASEKQKKIDTKEIAPPLPFSRVLWTWNDVMVSTYPAYSLLNMTPPKTHTHTHTKIKPSHVFPPRNLRRKKSAGTNKQTKNKQHPCLLLACVGIWPRHPNSTPKSFESNGVETSGV